MMDNKFLAINKNYFDIGLKSVDILIIAQIEEFQRNHRECYITNKQFSEISGESEDTIKRSLRKLEKMNVIKRNTTFIEGNGKANRRRTLTLNNPGEWKDHIAPTKMDSAEVDDGRCKKDKWKVQNAPIKDNIKDKEKDNMVIIRNIWDYIFFDEDTQEDIDLGLIYKSEIITENARDFIFDEFDRLGHDITFIASFDKIQSYKDGKCMGTYHTTFYMGGQ
jgi:DNA-binding Lrp family transcriptional regulator